MLSVPLMACTDSGARPAAYAARDRAGVEVVTNVGARCTTTNTGTLELEATIGAADGEAAFSQIGSMALSPDGELYVLDRLEKRVLVFGLAGTLLRSFGRLGDGPGEFHYPDYVGILGPDRIAVGDDAPSRLHVLTRGGEFVRQIRLEPPEDGASTGLANVVADWAVTPGGDVWAALRMYYGAETDSTPVRLVRFDASGEVADTVLRWNLPGYNHSYEIYGSRWQWAISVDGTVVTSPGRSHEIRFLWPDGRRLVARRDAPLIEVTPALREKVREEYFAYMERDGESPEMIRQARDLAQVPTPWPAVLGVLVSSPSGRVWARAIDPRVEDAETRKVRYDIYAPTGRYLGCVPMPRRFYPRLVTDSVVFGSWLDELDVPFVRAYKISRRKARPDGRTMPDTRLEQTR